MALKSSDYLSDHFAAWELGADQTEATDLIVVHLSRVAAWLEAARDVLGVPLTVTSGFRTAAHNAAVGGAADSDHLTGLAADFEAVGLTPYAAYTKLAAASLPAFDQVIFYAGDDHIHVGLGTAMRGEVLISVTEGSYVALTAELVSKLRGFV